MKQYTAEKIKNITLAGHSGSGKTSLAEAMLFKAGMSDRLGKITDGNTVCDYDAEEIKRKVSINTSLAYLEYNNFKINIIDTPGLFDFAAGLYEGIYACGTALITVSGKDGVKVGTEKAYKEAAAQGKSKLFVVTGLEDPNSNFDKALSGLQKAFGTSVVPVAIPVVKDGKVECIVNVIDNKAYAYDGKGNAKEVPVPSSVDIESIINSASEAIAEADEALMDKFFADEPFTYDELVSGLHKAVSAGIVSPVIGVSSVNLTGIDILLNEIIRTLPSADEENAPKAFGKGGEAVEVKIDAAAPLSAFVFKTIADPFVGKMSYIKIVSGKLSAEADAINSTTGHPEKIGKLYALNGKKQADVASASAGDIVAATKINANTSDTLCSGSKFVTFEKIKFPKPCYSMSVKAKSQGDESKISTGIQRLLEEDMTLSYVLDVTTKEQVLSGMGEQHIEIAVAKLKGKFGAEVELKVPKIAYKETIRKKVKVEGKHKKQSGGHGQYGHVWIEFEPCQGDELVFEEKVFGGSVPRNYFPAVEKGLQDCVKKGVLAGCPVVGLKATLVDGSYHPVDSSEMAFKTAASIAYKEGLKQAGPVLLEPIGTLCVTVSNDNTGDIMGDLNKRRGRVLGMNPLDDGMTEINAEVPIREMHDYAMLVRQVTMGRGWFTLDFHKYEQLPQNLVDEVVAAVKKKDEEKEKEKSLS